MMTDHNLVLIKATREMCSSMAACRCGEEHAVRNVAMQGLGSKDSLNLRDGTRKVEKFRRSIVRGGFKNTSAFASLTKLE